MKNTPFFIIGSKRGGTTLLRLMLNKNSKIAIPPESHFISTLVSHFRDYTTPLSQQELMQAKQIIQTHSRFKSWKISAQEFDDLVASLPKTTDLSCFLKTLFQYKAESMGKSRWGEKTPEYVHILPELHQLFPDACFIALFRDGRDVSMSLKERGWEGWSEYQRAVYWRACVRNILYLNKFPGSSIFVKYEDLVKDPVKTLHSITSFLEEDFEPQMLQYYDDYEQHITSEEIKNAVHTKLKREPNASVDVYKWKKVLNKSSIWKFESVCHKELFELNYEVTRYKRNSFWHRLLAWSYMIFGETVTVIYKLYHKIFGQEIKQHLRQKNLYNNLRATIRKL